MMKFATSMVILAAALSGANAFTTPASFTQRSSSTLLYADSDEDNIITNQTLETITRPLFTAVTSAVLATSLLFSNTLLPTQDVQAATPKAVSPIATSIDIEIKNIPSLTRKAIANRDALTNYVVESAKSIKPILELLSESDTVTVTPPKDVKGAVNALLTAGDAQFNVNGESVDVRVESVPGVIVVRVINPNIPRIPFLRDGTAALKFVDEIVDVAPAELNKIEKEAEAIEKFLTWGAPQKAPITYKGSTMDYFLSSKFLYSGNTVSLGALGDLTNSEVILGSLVVAIAGAYGSSYAYYTSVKEKEEQEAAEKKAKMAAANKAKAAAAKAKVEKKEKPAEKPKKVDEPKKEETVKQIEAAPEKKEEVAVVQTEEKKEEIKTVEPAVSTMKEEAKEEVKEESPTSGDDNEPKGRKRDAIKNLFRRKKA
jgi:chemotaxis protein histidine kinase CheA